MHDDVARLVQAANLFLKLRPGCAGSEDGLEVTHARARENQASPLLPQLSYNLDCIGRFCAACVGHQQPLGSAHRLHRAPAKHHTHPRRGQS
jgi:hypothetical protein